MEENLKPIRIGLLGQPKKFSQFYDAFVSYCATTAAAVAVCIPLQFLADASSATLVTFDGDANFEIDVLFHKLSDELATPEDRVAALRLEAVRRFALQHPRCLLFDALDSVALLTDRFKTLKALDSCDALGKLGCRVPLTELVDAAGAVRGAVGAADDHGDSPRRWMWKSVVACGTKQTHLMALSVGTSRPSCLPPLGTILRQQFIADAAPFVVKAYVAGAPQMAALRVTSAVKLCDVAASLCSEQRDAVFDSQDKTFFVPAADAPLAPPFAALIASADFNDRIRSAAVLLQEHVLQGMSLFGFDVLIVPAAGGSQPSPPPTCYIVDVNYFPSYKEVPRAHELILLEVQRRLGVHRSGFTFDRVQRE